MTSVGTDHIGLYTCMLLHLEIFTLEILWIERFFSIRVVWQRGYRLLATPVASFLLNDRHSPCVVYE